MTEVTIEPGPGHNISLRQGPTYQIKIERIGLPGPGNSLSIGTVQEGPTAQASITGQSPDQKLNLVLPKGDEGQPGQGFEPAGQWATDTEYAKNDLVSFNVRSFVSKTDGNLGNEPPSADVDDAWWMFVPAPAGADGREIELQKTATHIQWRYVGDPTWTDLVALADISGEDGAAATIAAGTVTMVANADPATVSNSGTTSAAVFDFEIPSPLDGQDGISFIWRGAYSGATAYAKDDVARDQGSSWIALQATTGNAPPTLPTTSNSYWELMSQRGQDGAGAGSVTSVALSAPTGFSVSGSPVTTSGTLTLAYASGYEGFQTSLKTKIDYLTVTAATDLDAMRTKLAGIANGATANTGTVTSVGVTVPTGFSVSGSPVTTSGTFAITYAAGYQGYTSAEASKLSGIASGATANTGTVTSVGLSLPTGLSVSGSPITTSGSFAVTFAAGYSIPTTTKQGQWDTAYGWGNHASAGYLTSAAIGSTVQGYNAKLAAFAANSGITGTITVSTSDPTGGADGDVWLKYTP